MTTNGQTPSEAAATAAAEHAEDRRATSATLLNDIVLDLLPVPPKVVRAAALRIPMPEMPKVWIESKGENRADPNDRGWEENPDSAEYKRAMLQWDIQTSDAGLKVGLILGTKCQSVPEGMYRPEDDGWIEELEGAWAALGWSDDSLVLHREPPQARYLDWLLNYALSSDEDLFLMSRAVYSTSMVTEEALREAVETFRRAEERPRTLVTALIEGDPDGDHLRATSAGGDS